MRNLSLVLGVIGMIAFAVLGGASAQEKDTPKKRPPFGGGFGPGMGGGFGGGGNPTFLVNSKMVKEEIKISDEQATKLKELPKAIGEKTAKLFEKVRDLPQEERREKFAELMKESNAIAMKELGEVLKPDQLNRLKQINVQISGVNAYRNPEVESALKLTADQKATIKESLDEYRKEVQELREDLGIRGFQPPPKEKAAEFEKKSSALQKEVTDKITKTLTDEQKTTWKSLTGEPFDVKKYQEEQRAAFGNFGPPRRDREKKKDD